jgi:cellulose synthase/poly-beta-1,6-N-acetylglucosamine synthase-like glycosyltransferase
MEAEDNAGRLQLPNSAPCYFVLLTIIIYYYYHITIYMVLIEIYWKHKSAEKLIQLQSLMLFPLYIFEIPTAVKMSMLVFTVIMQCETADRYQCFGGT